MPIAGTFLRTGAARYRGQAVLDRPDVDSVAAAVVDDLLFASQGPPPVTDIPYAWIVQPLSFRSDVLYTVATVSAGDVERQQSDATSVDEFGEIEFSATSDSAVDADATNLGSHVLTYYATQPAAVPRMRIPVLVIDLLPLTDVERWRVLALGLGDRIRVPDAPATWPEGASTAVIEGVSRVINLDRPSVAWNLAAVVGEDPGVPGPWFRLDSSLLDGTDKIPY